MSRRRPKKVIDARRDRVPRQIDSVQSAANDFNVYDCFLPCKSTSVQPAKSAVKASVGVRVSKAISHAWKTEVRQLAGQSAKTAVPSANVDIDDEITQDIVGNRTPDTTNGKVETGCQLVVARVYPIDLWYCIGKYVDPEDISCFAQICHGTHIVVHSAQFWRHVYRRFCQFASNLPSNLQPNAVLHRVPGLRTRVVRALYRVYPPLSSHISQSPAMHMLDLDRLTGLRCVRAWHEHLSSHRPTPAGQQPQQYWRFCFKFERPLSRSRQTLCALSPIRDTSDEHQLSHGNLVEHDDVLHNPDERSVVLAAISSHYTLLPVVMGQVLIKAAASTDGLFAHRLRLVFYSEYIHAGRGLPSGAIAVEIEMLNSINVLHWWHTLFPGNS